MFVSRFVKSIWYIFRARESLMILSGTFFSLLVQEINFKRCQMDKWNSDERNKIRRKCRLTSGFVID